MRVKEGFIIKDSLNNHVVIANGERKKDFKGLMKLNDVAVEIWRFVDNGLSCEEIAKNLTDKYEGLSFEKALDDVRKFAYDMISQGFFEE